MQSQNKNDAPKYLPEDLLMIATPEVIEIMLQSSGFDDSEIKNREVFLLDDHELETYDSEFSYLDPINATKEKKNEEPEESDEKSNLETPLPDNVFEIKNKKNSRRFKRKALDLMSSSDFLFYNKEQCGKSIVSLNESNVKKSFDKNKVAKGNIRKAYLINKKVS